MNMNTIIVIAVSVILINVLFFLFMTRFAKMRKKQEEEENTQKEIVVFTAEFFSARLGLWCGYFRHESVVKQGYIVNIGEQDLRKGSCCDVVVNGFDHKIGRWEVEAVDAIDD